jgi:hypothetical protein
MYALTQPLVSLLVRHPRLGGVFGLVMALFFGYLGISSWQAMQTMPQEPQQLTLAEAVSSVQSTSEDLWVSIDDGLWDCGNIVHEGDRTSVIFTDQAQSVLGLAVFSGSRDLTCDDLRSLAATGVLRILGDGEYQRLAARGFDLSGYGSANTRVGLCTFCGRGNSQGLVIMSAILLVSGLALYPICLYEHRRRLGKPGAFS